MNKLAVIGSRELDSILVPWLAYDRLVQALGATGLYDVTAVTVDKLEDTEQYSAYVFFVEEASSELLALAMSLELLKRCAIVYVARKDKYVGEYTKRFILKRLFFLEIEEAAFEDIISVEHITNILVSEETKKQAHRQPLRAVI